MDILIKEGTLVTGDGKTVIQKASILLKEGKIANIGRRKDDMPSCDKVDKVIDARGCYIIPGVINGLAHGCSVGPLFSSGALPLSIEEALKNCNRQLQQGVTTLINMSGFQRMDEVEEVNSKHPINIKASTCHFPLAIKAALMADGKGLKEKHINIKAEEMIKNGAIAIGEMGSGATLGGGVVDYKYIPEKIKKETKVEISAYWANRIKTAVLGRTLKIENFNLPQLEKILCRLNLKDKISISKIREIIEKIALNPVEKSLELFEEACLLSKETGVPVLFHNSLISSRKILELSYKYRNTKAKIIAGHCNHPSFDVGEALDITKRLKENGVIIDVSTLDSIITQWMNGPDLIDALIGEGLVDIISTDYGGGHWDGILEGIHHFIRKGLVTLPQGVGMVTGNVAKVHPLGAPKRGLIEKGKIADIVITDDKNIGRVKTVIISGKIVVDSGWYKYN